MNKIFRKLIRSSSNSPKVDQRLITDPTTWSFLLKTNTQAVISEIVTNALRQPKPGFFQMSFDGRHVAFGAQDGRKNISWLMARNVN